MKTLADEPKWVLEGALLTSDVPLSLNNLRDCLDKRFTKAQIRVMLLELRADWTGRALELKEVGDGLWRFQSVPAMRDVLKRLHPEEEPKYTRTVMETLAVIAYRQPVTRGDIEKIRGVSVNPNAIKTLIDRNWIEVIGRRETVGHPELFATTRQFLIDLGLNSLEDLPAIGSDEMPQGEAFELFDGQNAIEASRPKHPLLQAMDKEREELENMAQMLPFSEDLESENKSSNH